MTDSNQEDTNSSGKDHSSRDEHLPSEQQSGLVLIERSFIDHYRKENDNEHDIFIGNSIYQEAGSIFTPVKKLEEIKNDCIFVLDTNILLIPYTSTHKDFLEQCKIIFTVLCNEGRLVIPGQVAREFAKNRMTRLGELYQQLTDKKVPLLMNKGEYALLSSLQEYKDLIAIEKEIDDVIKKNKDIYEKTRNKLLEIVRSWNWDDPVSLLYNEVFSEEVIMDSSIEHRKEELRKDLTRRQRHKIPPGYKDGRKVDDGIGDLLIWDTILEIGRNKKKSVILVSNEKKADWYKGSMKNALYLRYELVNEFKQLSGGESFHVINFSQFLELRKADAKAIEAAQREEKMRKPLRLGEEQALPDSPFSDVEEVDDPSESDDTKQE